MLKAKLAKVSDAKL